MLANTFKKVFGSRNDRLIKRMHKTVEQINSMEPALEGLSDEQLRARTDEFRQRLADGETFNQLLPEAFATVREAARRTLEMRPFDVQLIGGMALHEGNIAEMRTGEGKTLVATLPAYLNALPAMRRAHRDRQRLPGAPRRRVDGRGVRLPGHAHRVVVPGRARKRSARPMPPTSSTAPTTNSASTTCATTWPSGRGAACRAS